MSYAAKSVMLPIWGQMVDPPVLSLFESPSFYDVDGDSPFFYAGALWEAKPIYTQIGFAISASGSDTESGIDLGGGFTRTIEETYSYSNTIIITRQSLHELVAGKTVEQQGLGNQSTLRTDGPLRVSRATSRNTADSGKALFVLSLSRGRKYTVEDLFNPPDFTSEVEFSLCDPDYQSMTIGGSTDPDLVDLSSVVIGTQTVTDYDPLGTEIGSYDYDIELDLTIPYLSTYLGTFVLDEWNVHDILRADGASMVVSSGATPVLPEVSDWDIDISAWSKAHWHDWTTAPDHPFTWSSSYNSVSFSVEATLS